MSTPVIDTVSAAVTDADLDDLASLLIDAIDSGASLSFLPPLARERATGWWRATLADLDPRGAALVARDEQGIVGSVQLQPAWAPNQPHRAEIAKLMVHRRGRRRGVGRALMDEAERRAAQAGFSLLTLDTRRGDSAEALYRSAGWTAAGVIPDYAVDAHGVYCDTIYFYKRLGA